MFCVRPPTVPPTPLRHLFSYAKLPKSNAGSGFVTSPPAYARLLFPSPSRGPAPRPPYPVPPSPSLPSSPSLSLDSKSTSARREHFWLGMLWHVITGRTCTTAVARCPLPVTLFQGVLSHKVRICCSSFVASRGVCLRTRSVSGDKHGDREWGASKYRLSIQNI